MTMKIYRYAQEDNREAANDIRIAQTEAPALESIVEQLVSSQGSREALYHGSKAYVRISGPVSFFKDKFEDRGTRTKVFDKADITANKPLVATIHGIAARKDDAGKAWLYYIYHDIVGQLLQDIEGFLSRLESEEASGIDDSAIEAALSMLTQTQEFLSPIKIEAPESLQKHHEKTLLAELFKRLPEPLLSSLAKSIAQIVIKTDLYGNGPQEFQTRQYSGGKKSPTGSGDMYTSQEYVCFYVMKDYRAQAVLAPNLDELALTRVTADKQLVILPSVIWNWLDLSDLYDKTGLAQNNQCDRDKLQEFAQTSAKGQAVRIAVRSDLDPAEIQSDLESLSGTQPYPIKDYHAGQDYVPQLVRIRVVAKSPIYIQAELPLPIVRNPDYTFDTIESTSGDVKGKVKEMAQRVLNAITEGVPLYYRDSPADGQVEPFTWADYMDHAEMLGTGKKVWTSGIDTATTVWSDSEPGDPHNFFRYPVGWKNLGLAYPSQEVQEKIEAGELPNPGRFVIEKEKVPFGKSKIRTEESENADESVKTLADLEEQYETAFRALIVHPKYIEKLTAQPQQISTWLQKIDQIKKQNFNNACKILNKVLETWGIEGVRAPSEEEIAATKEQSNKPQPQKSSQDIGKHFNKGDFSLALLERFAEVEKEFFVDLATNEVYPTEEEVKDAIAERISDNDNDFFVEEYTETLSGLLFDFMSSVKSKAQAQSSPEDNRVIDFPSYEREEAEEEIEQEEPQEELQQVVPFPEEAEEEEALPLAASTAKRLMALADRYDQLGLFTKADQIDRVLRKIVAHHSRKGEK